MPRTKAHNIECGIDVSVKRKKRDLASPIGPFEPQLPAFEARQDDKQRAFKAITCGRCCGGEPSMLGGCEHFYDPRLLKLGFCPRSNEFILQQLLPNHDVQTIHLAIRKANEMATTLAEPATKDKKNELIELDDRLTKCRLLMETTESELGKAVLMAQGLKLAKEYVAKQIAQLAPLADCELGFLTDRATSNKGAYKPEELVAPITAAIMRGLPLVGNCFNVMSGRCYVTREGYEYLFSHRVGCTFPDVRIGAVEIVSEPAWDETAKRAIPGTAKIHCSGSCEQNGVPYAVEFANGDGMDCRVAVKYNRGMSEDALVGKARARVLKALWKLVTNAAIDEPEEPDDTMIEVAAGEVAQ